MSSEVPPKHNATGLAERWAECSEGRDGSRHATTTEAASLAHAVEISLARGRATADLTRTARDWGAQLPSPSAVVSAVASLREAASMHVDPGGLGAITNVVPGNVLQILDCVLCEAIEGVSTSLREAALIDPLTGCANRRALKEDLERAVAGGRRTGLDVAVAVIDLDGLKQINDTHGHAVGDSTLQQLARALQSAVRETDAVYRVGGDEFVVVIPFSGTGGAAAAMQRARAQGAPAFSWGAASLSMLAAGSDVEKLIELADASLYASRRNVRPIAAAPLRRHRAALVGAAAAAIVGIGLSSSFVLPSYLDRAAIGAPQQTNGNGNGHLGARGSAGSHSSASSSSGSRTVHSTSVPPSGESNPPASDRTVRTEGPNSGVTSSGPGALTVAKTILPVSTGSPTHAVLTVSVNPTNPPKAGKTHKTPKSPTTIVSPVKPTTPVAVPVPQPTPEPVPPTTTPPAPTTPGGSGGGHPCGQPPPWGTGHPPAPVGNPAPGRGPGHWPGPPRDPGWAGSGGDGGGSGSPCGHGDNSYGQGYGQSYGQGNSSNSQDESADYGGWAQG